MEILTFSVKGISFSKRYAQQILKLNLLSPRIKEAIMSGNQPKNLLLDDVIKKPLPLLWQKQEEMLGSVSKIIASI
jgi:hypothetical protein